MKRLGLSTLAPRFPGGLILAVGLLAALFSQGLPSSDALPPGKPPEVVEFHARFQAGKDAFSAVPTRIVVHEPPQAGAVSTGAGVWVFSELTSSTPDGSCVVEYRKSPPPDRAATPNRRLAHVSTARRKYWQRGRFLMRRPLPAGILDCRWNRSGIAGRCAHGKLKRRPLRPEANRATPGPAPSTAVFLEHRLRDANRAWSARPLPPARYLRSTMSI